MTPGERVRLNFLSQPRTATILYPVDHSNFWGCIIDGDEPREGNDIFWFLDTDLSPL